MRKYRVLSKGNENTVVMVTEPSLERGQIILMKGRDLWVFMPDVSQPVQSPLAQRLTGQGPTAIWPAPISPATTTKILRSETIGSDEFHVLELTAVDRSVTYQRVMYWVEQKRSGPLGRVPTHAVESPPEEMPLREIPERWVGKPRPTRLVMGGRPAGNEQSVLNTAR